MGRGQAGAPADDDHVPWSRPSWYGHRDLAGHGAGRPGPGGAGGRRPGSLNWSGPRPGSGPKGQQGGAGAKPPEAAEGLRKSSKEQQRLRCCDYNKLTCQTK
jgi:hypothetical protein